jgi:osmoprotectant transport system ATP-binding protein
MVNRMIEPTSGRITIDGEDTASMQPAQLRRGIGYVIQHAGLFPHRTVVDNVSTVPRLLGWDRARARARSMELLELVGLPSELARRYPHQLSGGQQQRVGVARALAADPPVMLMDEPFSAVDPVVREQLQDEFLRLQGELGKTIVMVTHDIDEAIKLGDCVAVMRVGGRLAQLASPADLLSRPADAFVAGFVGRDRGYRALGFASAGTFEAQPEPTVRVGERMPTGVDDWTIAVNDADEPQGWLPPAGERRDAATSDGNGTGDGTVTDAMLHRGGTLVTQGGSLRAALDACLSSPAGRGVVVDERGRLVGSITAAEVLGLIEGARS